MKTLIFILMSLLIASYSYAWPAKFIDAHDGDTLKVQDGTGKIHKIRLYGIDCPEIKQPFGVEARDAVIEALKGKEVEVVVITSDKYKRSVSGVIVYHDMFVLQDFLVTNGYAWVDERFCKKKVCMDWKLHQVDAAKSYNQRGLWADENPIPPWIWRKK